MSITMCEFHNYTCLSPNFIDKMYDLFEMSFFHEFYVELRAFKYS